MDRDIIKYIDHANRKEALNLLNCIADLYNLLAIADTYQRKVSINNMIDRYVSAINLLAHCVK